MGEATLEVAFEVVARRAETGVAALDGEAES